jgi:hypothetical protein
MFPKFQGNSKANASATSNDPLVDWAILTVMPLRLTKLHLTTPSTSGQTGMSASSNGST